MGDDFAAEAVAFDVEETGGVGLVASGDFQHAGDEEAFGVGEARDRIGFECGVGPGIGAGGGADGVANFGGEMGDINRAITAEEEGSLDGIAEFADVAGPIIALERVFGSECQLFCRFSIGGGDIVDELVGERQDFVAAAAQRLDAEADDVEAEVEILAEGSFADHCGEVAMCGGDDSEIDGNRLHAADGDDRSFLDAAEEFGLNEEG